jgi:hypothetical protein
MKKARVIHNANINHKEALTFTQKVASFITDKVGTFSCFVFFAILACLSLPAIIQANSVILWIQWITQSFLQLVLLPLIMIGQNLQSKHSEHIAEATYKNDIEMHIHVDEIEDKCDLILKKICQ